MTFPRLLSHHSVYLERTPTLALIKGIARRAANVLMEGPEASYPPESLLQKHSANVKLLVDLLRVCRRERGREGPHTAVDYDTRETGHSVGGGGGGAGEMEAQLVLLLEDVGYTALNPGGIGPGGVQTTAEMQDEMRRGVDEMRGCTV